ncbi:MAG: 2-oxoacid:acceptor oxidoreductase family protein [Ignavibacteriales bacterium]|nr:2-oxoacid:acceptor oxidoreductase family protein [Ignavibacteriales bacterium]
MYHSDEIILAGFGGQGVLSMGQVLSYAAIIDNKETTWMPSYGPEMRGGTANCIVIVSDRRVSSPIITKFDSGIILNQPSMEKFEPAIKKNGFLFYEESTVVYPPTRDDITIIKIAAIHEAELMKKKQVANMIMLGAFLEVKPIVTMDSVLKALKKVLPERHHHLIPLNEQAILRGKELALQQLHLTI